MSGELESLDGEMNDSFEFSFQRELDLQASVEKQKKISAVNSQVIYATSLPSYFMVMTMFCHLCNHHTFVWRADPIRFKHIK